ncbi:MAG: hypothetical protein HOJ57_01800 [Lentisphaerae bacterium]|jgi:hypothetical protein|nr:hypothetical protein [Lentisphaerota bacterium]MBT5604642.1 hypothetical protein [Lentisphaerota bacterium]
MWLIDGSVALCIEAKTEKDDSAHYRKAEVSQLSDHVQWVQDNTSADSIVPILVGPLVPATRKANPGRDVLVIELSEFDALAQRLTSALADAATKSLPLTLRSNLMDVFTARGLLWPDVFESMSKTPLRNLTT